jgi:hypothetical protein
MDEILKRDQNSAIVLGGVTDDANQYIRMLRVDPITNRLLCSGAGGSGLTEITFTGAVNGVNTSFTGLQPTYAVIDGIWLKEFDNNGVRQWAWSAGTLTTTLPPQSSIYGF